MRGLAANDTAQRHIAVIGFGALDGAFSARAIAPGISSAWYAGRDHKLRRPFEHGNRTLGQSVSDMLVVG